MENLQLNLFDWAEIAVESDGCYAVIDVYYVAVRHERYECWA